DAQRASDDGWIATEALSPERRADQNDRRPFRFVLVGRKRTPDERLDAQHSREVVRDLQTRYASRAGCVRQVEVRGLEDRDGVEQLLVLAPAIEVGIVDPDDVQVPLRRFRIDIDKALRMRERERP